MKSGYPGAYGEPGIRPGIPFMELIEPSLYIGNGLSEAGSSCAHWGKSLIGRITRNWRIYQTIAALSALDDQLLKDIGIARWQIPQISVQACAVIGRDS